VYFKDEYELLREKRVFVYEYSFSIYEPNFEIFNYITSLFYLKHKLMSFPETIYSKLLVRKFEYRSSTKRNYIYYAKRLYLELKSARSIIQLTARYRNKFFTFLKKKLHFSLSVGRVYFWKLKKTIPGRIINFFNVFFRFIIPFLSKYFIFILHKFYSDWSSDFQKFNISITRAKKRKKIRRKHTFFKVLIFPKLGFGYMRLPKYPIRKRFLQRRGLIKYTCI